MIRVACDRIFGNRNIRHLRTESVSRLRDTAGRRDLLGMVLVDQSDEHDPMFFSAATRSRAGPSPAAASRECTTVTTDSLVCSEASRWIVVASTLRAFFSSKTFLTCQVSPGPVGTAPAAGEGEEPAERDVDLVALNELVEPPDLPPVLADVHDRAARHLTQALHLAQAEAAADRRGHGGRLRERRRARQLQRAERVLAGPVGRDIEGSAAFDQRRRYPRTQAT